MDYINRGIEQVGASNNKGGINMILEKKHREFLRWAELEAGRSRATLRIYREAFTDYSNYCHRQQIEISSSTADIREYFFSQAEKGLKKTTTLVRHKALKAFFKYLVFVDKSLKINPIDDIYKPQPEKKLAEFFTTTECELIREVMQGYNWANKFTAYRNRLVVDLLLFCGLRKSELLDLKILDINIDKKFLIVRGGKGGKDRIIKLHDTVVNTLVKYLHYRGNRSINNLLISSARHQQPFSDTGLKQLMRLIKRQTNLERVYAHKFRHSFATCMLEHGGRNSLNYVKEVLGHSKIETTAMYLHLTPEMQTEHIRLHPLGKEATGNAY